MNFGALGSLGAAKIDLWVQEVPAKRDPPKEIRPSDLGLPEATITANGLQQDAPAGNAVQEAPPRDAPQRMEIIPDRMLARENVQLNSSESLRGGRGVVGLVQASRSRVGAGSRRRRVPYHLTAPATQRSSGPTARSARPGPSDTAFPRGRKIVAGEHSCCSAAGSELAKLTVEDNVRIRETQTVEPGAKPVVITGDQVCVFDASKPTMSATVKGNLAHVEGRGMSLSGPNIHVNCGTNKLEVQGPGAWSCRWTAISRAARSVTRTLRQLSSAFPPYLHRLITICWMLQMRDAPYFPTL